MKILEYGGVPVEKRVARQSWELLSADGRGPWNSRLDQAWLKFRPSAFLTELLEVPAYGVRRYDWVPEDDEFRSFNALAYDIALGIHTQLRVLLSLGSGSLKDKTIQDLGCGSNGSYDTSNDAIFWQPWLCRFLAKMGVKVIGIDIGNLDGETFEAHQANLLDDHALDFLSNQSIDIANVRQLFNSPQLHNLIPDFETYRHDPWARLEIARLLERSLATQLARVVKPTGTVIYRATMETFGERHSSIDHWQWENTQPGPVTSFIRFKKSIPGIPDSPHHLESETQLSLEL